MKSFYVEKACRLFVNLWPESRPFPDETYQPNLKGNYLIVPSRAIITFESVDSNTDDDGLEINLIPLRVKQHSDTENIGENCETSSKDDFSIVKGLSESLQNIKNGKLPLSADSFALQARESQSSDLNKDKQDCDCKIDFNFNHYSSTAESSSDEESVNIRKKAKSFQSNSSRMKNPFYRQAAFGNVNDDHLLKLQPKVHVLKLTKSMIDSKYSASSLDTIYSKLSENLINGTDFIHRHVGNVIDLLPFNLNPEPQVQINKQKSTIFSLDFEDDVMDNVKPKVKHSRNSKNKHILVTYSSEDDLDSDSNFSDIMFNYSDDDLQDNGANDSSNNHRKRKLDLILKLGMAIRVVDFPRPSSQRNSSEGRKRKRETVFSNYFSSSDDSNEETDSYGSDFSEIGLNDSSSDDSDEGKAERNSNMETKITKNGESIFSKKFNQAKRVKADLNFSFSERDDSKNVDSHSNGSKSPGKVPIEKSQCSFREIPNEVELEIKTIKAVTMECDRVQRINEQTQQYNKIMPESEREREESKLILDIDGETKQVRVEVNPILVKLLKPHQVEGIKFLYNSTIENVDKLKGEGKGSGCILAHCMGLGKSLQVITFVHTLLSNHFTNNHVKTILIAAPVNTLKNWVEEFDKWIVKKGLETFEVHEINDETIIKSRLTRLNRWQRKGGVLIIGHTLLSNLLNLHDSKKKVATSHIKFIDQYLADPGPDMVIIDEGHRLKSLNRICKAVVSMKTRRKIILTGTPLQNNLDEYYTMIDIIKPRLLGSKKDFANRFRNPIENGQKADASDEDFVLMKRRATVLHQLLSSSIQRYDFGTLKNYLQPKFEYALFIRPSKLMVQMYNFYLDQVQKERNHLLDAGKLLFLINHPAIYHLQEANRMTKRQAATSIQPNRNIIQVQYDSNLISLISESGSNASTFPQSDDSQCKEVGLIPSEEGSTRNDWFKQFVKPDDWKDIQLSGKFVMLIKILEGCVSVGDKLVVASQSLETLDIIEKLLHRFENGFGVNWKQNINYFRIDGSTKAEIRFDQIRQFNDQENKEAKVFLLSTRAGGLGINLTGANRCIIFDASWNPSDDIQAIFRVFRLGQTKPVYVYRFVTKDTMEEQIFRKQVVKLGMSIRVIDKQQVKRAFKASELDVFYAIRPKNDYQSSLFDVPKDCLLADIFHSGNNEVLECIEFDSLLEVKPEEELSEEERLAVWVEYQMMSMI